jgi:hypothetical protein
MLRAHFAYNVARVHHAHIARTCRALHATRGVTFGPHCETRNTKSTVSKLINGLSPNHPENIMYFQGQAAETI